MAAAENIFNPFFKASDGGCREIKPRQGILHCTSPNMPARGEFIVPGLPHAMRIEWRQALARMTTPPRSVVVQCGMAGRHGVTRQYQDLG